MRLSIVVITHNRRELLKRCLASLLEQDFPVGSLQIVVSDDGSTDGTREAVQSLARENPHLQYVFQPHRGIPAARNSGLEAADGDLIAFLADDYRVAPDYAGTVVSFFQKHPEAMIVRFKVVSDEDHFGGRLSQLFYEASICRRLLPRVPPGPLPGRLAFYLRKMPRTEEAVTVDHDLEPVGGAAFRRGVFEIVGLFDESLARTEDTDMMLRLKSHGIPIHYNPFHEIRHHYDRLPLDTLRKSYLSGLNRFSLDLKNKSAPSKPAEIIRDALTEKLAGLLLAFWKARQTDSAAAFFLYLPFMFVFETADKVGYLAGLAGQSRRRSQKAEGP